MLFEIIIFKLLFEINFVDMSVCISIYRYISYIA